MKVSSTALNMSLALWGHSNYITEEVMSRTFILRSVADDILMKVLLLCLSLAVFCSFSECGLPPEAMPSGGTACVGSKV
ncbi:hypothetical protein V5799_003717 [Amblyomma americanum]|uniref:Uncharacterized protein n=1 Tax=Amblyomma americanum TaxID=6943 RepID=A0AAQ4D861_AMBAM